MDLLLSDHRDQVGESPVWSVAEQALYWVDIEGRALRRWSFPDRRLCSWEAGERLACLGLHADGGLVAGMETGVFQLQPGADGSLGAQRLAGIGHPRPAMRFNDGRCDRQGRFWAGTMLRDTALAQPAGSLYRMDPRGLSAPLVSGLVTPNGLAFSPDGATMYLSDSHPGVQRIWSMPLHDDGTPGPRTVFADMRALPGRPDGAAIDAEGCYWICGNDAAVLHRFTPQGRLDRSLAVPTSKPSMCSFGGPGLDLLFITSIRPDRPQGDDVALGGAVFVARPGVSGLPETPYRCA
ncbi:SMP-30/gluconolactonase/LRE family protein [Verminephrobacter aporrectodeae subsp. tuberculatae]|uniref:SMP-30/gluconolactonase/LRE family protein n=1 Tax=Verminephrobacter aporrectodeae subsp. tuberculatae TaxID=1110392 RepID=A0ABT3KUE1_9BURK|nr:SMP-30/gluconolactonase/LRE family protein [Verminephrobacter aporrectodeae]MCW5256860.1 SMP-30/gluconolactonase/LRE family protein [Verminephrobacter aporrectodeae subsp. tuberculatae]MCW5321974.1 SMP-30/gluconolactonase/LRE family protein [Verminephrobacter aporrectodeae subsp. tuberculatae]